MRVNPTQIDLNQFMSSSLCDLNIKLFDYEFAKNIYELLSLTCVGVQNGEPVTLLDCDPDALFWLKSRIETLSTRDHGSEVDLKLFLNQLTVISQRINKSIAELSETPIYTNFLIDSDVFHRIVNHIKTYIDLSYGLGNAVRKFKADEHVTFDVPAQHNVNFTFTFKSSQLPVSPQLFSKTFAEITYRKMVNVLREKGETDVYDALCNQLKNAIETATAAEGKLGDLFNKLADIEQQLQKLKQSVSPKVKDIHQDHSVETMLKAVIQDIRDDLTIDFNLQGTRAASASDSSSLPLLTAVQVPCFEPVEPLVLKANIEEARKEVATVQAASNRIQTVINKASAFSAAQLNLLPLMEHVTAVGWYRRLSNAAIQPDVCDGRDPKQFAHFPTVCKWFKDQIETLRFPQNQAGLQSLFQFVATADQILIEMRQKSKDVHKTVDAFISVYSDVISELKKILSAEFELFIDENEKSRLAGMAITEAEVLMATNDSEDNSWQRNYTTSGIQNSTGLFESLSFRTQLVKNMQHALSERFVGNPLQYSGELTDNAGKLIDTVLQMLNNTKFLRDFGGMEAAYKNLFETITCKNFDPKLVGMISTMFIKTIAQHSVKAKLLDEEGVEQLLQSINAFIQNEKSSMLARALGSILCFIGCQPIWAFTEFCSPEMREIIGYQLNQQFDSCSITCACVCCPSEAASYYSQVGLYPGSGQDAAMYCKQVYLCLFGMWIPLLGEIALCAKQWPLLCEAISAEEPNKALAESVMVWDPRTCYNACWIWKHQRQIEAAPSAAAALSEDENSRQEIRTRVQSRYGSIQ